jgi:hypothetical protein
MKLSPYVFLAITLLICSCSHAQQQEAKPILYHYTAQKMKKTYFANYEFSGDFEIIFNGTSLIKNKEDGVISGLLYLNPFISQSGKQSLTFVLKPLHHNFKIQPEEVKNYFIDVMYSDNAAASPLTKVMRCAFTPVTHAVDSLTQTWVINADVPYRLEGYTNSLDLTEEDPAKLKLEVLAYYKNVYQLINEGNSAAYLQLFKKSREREIISMYYDVEKQKKYLESLANRVSSSKGFMQPLEKYQIVISANGRLVKLETKQGKSPLFSKDKQGKHKRYGLELHRVKGSNKLEVY